MATVPSNHIKYLLATKVIDFLNDTFIIILMDSGFVFNIDTHENYAQVSGSELDTANGYTVKTKTLAGVGVAEDDSADKAIVTWNNVVWTASGGSITSSGAIIIDDTAANDPVVGYIDFSGDQTVLDTGTFTISNVTFELA